MGDAAAAVPARLFCSARLLGWGLLAADPRLAGCRYGVEGAEQ
jgi:hypothetical protein